MSASIFVKNENCEKKIFKQIKRGQFIGRFLSYAQFLHANSNAFHTKILQAFTFFENFKSFSCPRSFEWKNPQLFCVFFGQRYSSDTCASLCVLTVYSAKCCNLRSITVKKGYLHSRPQPGCHLQNSPRESLVSDLPAGDRNVANLFSQCKSLRGRPAIN
jgi:hypothetical protein